MLRPGRPVAGHRPDRFRPPHCPWKDCPKHTANRSFRYTRQACYRRTCDPRRQVPRFRCKTCGRGFSRQSFDGSYYLKRPELLAPIAAGLVAGSAHRQIARSLGCAPSTVTRMAARLGRIALLLQAEALEQLGRLDEPVVFDHFETFAFSQDDRLGIGTAVGQQSWFVYSFDPAPHRRAGRRSLKRKTPQTPLPDPEPRSVVRSAARVLRLLGHLGRGTLRLVTDDHPAYRSAVKSASSSLSITHHVYPNPPRGPGSDPAVSRARDGAMFPVDLLHKLVRHSQAHHHRKGIAFGRRTNALLERVALLAVWRNFIKGVSERKPDPTTPAMRLRLTPRRWSWSEVLSRRRFPGRIAMPEGWMKIYRRDWITPAVGRNTRHTRQHAF